MAAYPPAAGGLVLKTPVELHISCKDLRKADTFSKSDPLAAVYTNEHGKWIEYTRTELIKNDQNPNFTKAVAIDYRFEEVQKLKFAVYDLDNESVTLSDDDFLGEVECTLGEVVSAAPFTKPLHKRSGKEEKGTITIRAEEVSQNQSSLLMKFSAQGLDKKDFLGKSDPYLEFKRKNTDGSFTSVYKTEMIKNTLNPSWPAFRVNSRDLCNSDPDRLIQVQCYDWDSDGSHDLIGECTITLAELSKAAQGGKAEQWPLINPSKQAKKKSYKNSGTLKLESITISPLYTFLEYIMGGCQINFTVGIDFTGSNGDPRKPNSLHYIDPHRPNQYQQALMAVGAICQDYDTDKFFPALGFGGKIQGQVSHEFALNGNPQNPYCLGIQGVAEAYQTALRSVELWGPTNAAPIINHVAKFAAQAAAQPNSQQYFILLMLTDGALSDMPDTKLALVNASKLPMSVIIVGVGGANFSSMRELDSDDKLLKAGSHTAVRDIVQFVPFREFSTSPPAALASAVLAEIPQQLTEYMRLKNIQPMGAQHRAA